jgi:arsenite/tail-anchored protein-transporting ATPase
VLDARLILVTGKGGTGKSTVAAALGRRSADAGKRTLVVEVDVRQSAMSGLLGRAASYEPRPVGPRLEVCNITWDRALEEWLDRSIPLQRVVRMILRNRLVSLFLDATPGLREIVGLSRIASLCEGYDQVVVDMPASGHALALLQVPWVARELVAEGPIQQRAAELIELLGRPDTQAVLVSLPEEIVVNETVELLGRLERMVPVLAPPLVLLNQVAPPSITADERALLARIGALIPAEGPGAELIAAGRWEAELEDASRLAIDRLTGAGSGLLCVPRLGAQGGLQGGPEAVVIQLARALVREQAAGEGA